MNNRIPPKRNISFYQQEQSGIPPKQNINKSPWSFYQQDRNLNIKTIKDSAVLYLYNYNTGEEIELDVVPEAVSATYTSRIAKQAPFGVMHPINFYTGGTAKSISFGIDLHEDLDGLQVDANTKSIYALIDRLKSMSEPKSLRGRLREPLVYMQLGHQFAGKGHIKTGVTFNTPIRRGRYIYINLSVNFTYHEDFQISDIDIVGDTYSATHSGILSEVFNVDDDNYDDFFKKTFDYEYVLTQVFADAKITNYLNTMGKNDKFTTVIAAGKTGNIGHFVDTFESTFNLDLNNRQNIQYNVFGVITLIAELGAIIKPLTDVNTTLTNLKILLRKITDVRLKVAAMTQTQRGDYLDDTDRNAEVWLSERDWYLLLDVLYSLTQVTNNQINAYSALRGATP